MIAFVVFFQAEDGIRDLVRSRGLGDVYKRQQQQGFDFCYDKRLYDRLLYEPAESVRGHLMADLAYQEPVSYTHLTLPTSDLV